MRRRPFPLWKGPFRIKASGKSRFPLRRKAACLEQGARLPWAGCYFFFILDQYARTALL